MSLRVWLLLGFAALSGACKGSSDQDSRPLPSPEPPASAAAPVLHEDTPAPKKRSSDDTPRDASKPKHAAEEPAPAAAPTNAPSAEPNAPAEAAPSAAAPAASVAAPSAACLARCQNALQGCLAQPVDGGVPGFSNVEVCKKALAACQGACAN